MEFIIFLSQIDKEIIELIKKVNYSIEENTALCLIDNKFIGLHKRRDKAIVICTENAKRISKFRVNKRQNNNNHQTKLLVRRALRHEAIHMAQSCNNDNLLGLIKNPKDKIHKKKLEALKKSVKISGNLLKEIEAYIMEDKPREVKKAITNYCL